MNVNNKYFINGRIDFEFITSQISNHKSKKDIGAHTVFLGQVRSDKINGANVAKIIYTAYKEMAEKELNKIRESVINKYELKCLHIYHSLGEINAGEVAFFVFGSASHRDNIFDSIKEAVELVKSNVPIWKKEIVEN